MPKSQGACDVTCLLTKLVHDVAYPTNCGREGKSKAMQILDAVRKTLKDFLKDDDEFNMYMDTWTASMEALEKDNNCSEPLPWRPLRMSSNQQVSRDRGQTRPVNQRRDTERQIREEVPQILHENWAKKDRDRANEVVSTPALPDMTGVIFAGPKRDIGWFVRV